MNIRRNFAALALGTGLVLASGAAAHAYPENPPTGELVGVSEDGATLGQSFNWVIRTDESQRVVVSVDHEVPAGYTCPPVQIVGAAGNQAEVATPNEEHSVALTLQHPGEHVVTARDADTGDIVAAHTVYAAGDAADNCTVTNPQLLVTGAQNGLPAGTAPTLAALLLGAGGVAAYFLSRRRTAVEALGEVPPHFGGHTHSI